MWKRYRKIVEDNELKNLERKILWREQTFLVVSSYIFIDFAYWKIENSKYGKWLGALVSGSTDEHSVITDSYRYVYIEEYLSTQLSSHLYSCSYFAYGANHFIWRKEP